MWPFTKKERKKERKYDGASKAARLDGWITAQGDANAQIQMSLGTLRERSRDLRRNNAYIHKIIETISNQVVGKGIKTRFENENLNAVYKNWAGSTDIDYDGRHDLAGLQRLALESMVESGEVLIRIRLDRSKEFPLQFQVLEADFLDGTFYDTKASESGNFIIQGVEFNQAGKRVGYHLYESHPGSFDHPFNSLKTNFIPSNEILHLFKQERPGQVRGVPWTAPIMIKAKDLDDFEDAELMAKKITACFAGFIKDINGDVECDDKSNVGAKIQPGTIEELPPGKDMIFSTPQLLDNYKEFTSSHLRALSSGMGVTYESTTGDYSETNYSAARAGKLDMDANTAKTRDGIIIPHMCTPVAREFLRIAELMGMNTVNKNYTHIPPKSVIIDPTKEVPAMIDMVRAGFSSRSEMISSMGKDPDAVDMMIKQDNQKADQMGFVFDSDPRMTAGGGKKQDTATENNEESADDGQDD